MRTRRSTATVDGWLQQAAILSRLGDTLHAAGDPLSGRDAWQEALEVIHDLRHPAAERLRARLATSRPAMAHHRRHRPGRRVGTADGRS